MTASGNSPEHIDPEAEALLVEMASHPDSWLLRAPRGASTPTFDQRIDIDAHATGLSLASRHLLSVHRAEVALLARERLAALVLEAASAKRVATSRIDTRRSTRYRRGADWRRAAQSELETSELDRASSARDGLRELLALDGHAAPNPLDLAVFAERLEPSRSTRSYAALHLVAIGAPSSATRIFSAVAAEERDPFLASLALQNLALALQHAGRREDSLRALNLSARRCEDRGLPDVFAIPLALELDDRAALDECSHRLESLLTVDHPVIDEYVSWLGEARRAGWVQVPSRSRDEWLRAIDRLGAVTRRVAQAYAFARA